MHADGIDVLHITYGDAVAYAVTHYFVLNLFPTRDTTLYQYLSYTGQT